MSENKFPKTIPVPEGYLTVRTEEAYNFLKSIIDNGNFWDYLSETFNSSVVKQNQTDDKMEQVLILLNEMKSKVTTKALPSAETNGDSRYSIENIIEPKPVVEEERAPLRQRTKVDVKKDENKKKKKINGKSALGMLSRFNS